MRTVTISLVVELALLKVCFQLSACGDGYPIVNLDTITI